MAVKKPKPKPGPKKKYQAPEILIAMTSVSHNEETD